MASAWGDELAASRSDSLRSAPSRWLTRLVGVCVALTTLSIDTQPAASQDDDTVDLTPLRDRVFGAGPPAGDDEVRRDWLAARIEELIAERSVLAGARVGIAVADPLTGQMLYERNADSAYSIASNAKIVTAAAALALLGPEYRYYTAVFAERIGGAGAVLGDLYVRGRGDPSFGTWSLAELADDIAHAGITRIRGGIVLDDSYFDEVILPPRFADVEDAGDEHASYRAPIGALSLNFNTFNIVVTPAMSGRGPARVVIEPPNDYVKIERAQVFTTTRGRNRLRVQTRAEGDQMVVTVVGQMRRDRGVVRYRRRVLDPAQYFGQCLRAALEQRGVAVANRDVRRGPVPDSALRIAQRSSPPLAELIRGLGKYSNNYVAEMLLKTIGAESGSGELEAPASWGDAVAAVSQFLIDEVGLAPGSFRFDNGSGLFDATAFTPRQMVHLLATIGRDFRYGSDLLSSLSLAGADGTLARRLAGTEAERLVRAKTGTLATVSALSGYAAIDARHPLAFAIFVNDTPRSHAARYHARSLQDDVAEALILYLRGGL